MPAGRDPETGRFTPSPVDPPAAPRFIPAHDPAGDVPIISAPVDPPASEAEEEGTPCYYCGERFAFAHGSVETPVTYLDVAGRRRSAFRDVCDSCDSRRLVCCEECGEERVEEEVPQFGGRILCTDCITSFRVCSDCDIAYNSEQHRFCPDCSDREIDEDDAEDDAAHLLDSYGTETGHRLYDVGGFRLASEEGNHRLYLGLELEIETNGEMRQARDLCLATFPSICKADGSLSSEGMEWVSSPRTPALWRQDRQAVTDTLLRLRRMGCRSYNTTTCGLHIHLSKAAFLGTAHIYKFLALVYHNPQFILRISRRASMDAMCQWAGFSDCTLHKLPQKVKLGGSFARYAAVNLQNARTLELRFFRGTLNPDGVYRALQFAEALWDYSRDVSLEDAPHLGKFREYITAHSKAYPDLAAFLGAMKLPHAYVASPSNPSQE